MVGGLNQCVSRTPQPSGQSSHAHSWGQMQPAARVVPHLYFDLEYLKMKHVNMYVFGYRWLSFNDSQPEQACRSAVEALF